MPPEFDHLSAIAGWDSEFVIVGRFSGVKTDTLRSAQDGSMASLHSAWGIIGMLKAGRSGAPSADGSSVEDALCPPGPVAVSSYGVLRG